MSSNGPGLQAQYQQNYFNYYAGVPGTARTSSGHNLFVGDNWATDIADIDIAANNQPDSEDEEGELKPQYYPLPTAAPFLSVSEIDLEDDYGYDEIQVSLPYLGHQPRPPTCDKAAANHKPHTGVNPIVYECRSCIQHQRRPLCKRCARKEFKDEAGYHKPTHHVEKWQPFWVFPLTNGFRDLPIVSPSMEALAGELRDNVRAASFKSRQYYDDRIIRCFIPSPRGVCRVWIAVRVKPLKNIEMDRDMVDKVVSKIKRLSVSHDEADVVGTIAVSAYPCKMTNSPREPLKDVDTRPPEPRKKASDITDTHAVDIKRDFDTRNELTLCVEVTPKDFQEDAIELVIQDRHYKPEDSKYRSESIKWTLEGISVRRFPGPRPLAEFASMDQVARQQKIEAKEQADERQQRNDKMEADRKERQEKMEADRQKWQEWQEHNAEIQAKQREEREKRNSTQAAQAIGAGAAGAVLSNLPRPSQAQTQVASTHEPLHHHSSNDQAHMYPPQLTHNSPVHPAHNLYHPQRPPPPSTAQAKYTPAYHQPVPPPQQHYDSRGRTNPGPPPGVYHSQQPPLGKVRSSSANRRPEMLAPPPLGGTIPGRGRSESRSSVGSRVSSSGRYRAGSTGLLAPPSMPRHRSGSVSSVASSVSSGGSSTSGRRVRINKAPKPPPISSGLSKTKTKR